MTGTSEGNFSPNEQMTRAMVWTVLGRMAGADVDGIGRGRIDGNGLHKNHSLVRISRLWLVAPMRSGRSQMERWYLT